MTNEEQALSEIRPFIKRLTRVLDGTDSPDWRMEWEIVKNDILEFTRATFDANAKEYSTVFSVFKRRSIHIYGTDFENWSQDYGEPMERALKLIEYRLAKGQTKLVQDEPQELLIGAGTPHSAYVLLRDMVEKASQSVLIVDPWVDRTLFDLLSNVPASVGVRILTRQQYLPSDFTTEATKFKQQHSARVEVRVGLSDLHDRFLAVDDRLFFSGASFKDLGKKGSMVIEIFDVRAETVSALEASWNAGKVLV